MAGIEDIVETIKDKIPDITPTPPHLHQMATAHELKSRLDWGEPGLTILDLRDAEAFHKCRIMGAMNAQTDNLVGTAEASLSPKRDIYLYAETDQETENAANILRQAGYEHVAHLQGGLAMWREIGGAVEGTDTEEKKPQADAYNVVSRMSQFEEDRAKERSIE
jgi:rhodanese-related sulfurtransferase